MTVGPWQCCSNVAGCSRHCTRLLSYQLLEASKRRAGPGSRTAPAIREPVRTSSTANSLLEPVSGLGLSPAETATVLVDAGTQPALVLDTLDARCDHDTDTALAFATGAGIDHDTIHAWRNPAPMPPAVSIGAAVSADAAATLLAVQPPPGPSVELDPTRRLDTLTGIEPTHLEPVHP